ncbi:MAG TPA: inositol monophosphatase family protein [Acidobacteriota bacterium]|nr:inositol monophosphatase family protein [Acidobacteriota bacterium]HMZ81381.1 inositol monophosphatase family protein [Acidobacteriota bacterium]HNB71432.1 inositol monophosphatase family protein [Acidobacteriota bacterium]HNC42614.1 inositol monophosphatase family protein [Acidobacteriota bacterium]HND18874.1 inositol monophosphatase family protein [Acidobacteriota bacterium]
MLSFAKQLAKDAGKILREHVGRDFEVRHKGQIDLVTEVDLLSEKFIRDQIANHYPKHQVLAEESGLFEQTSPYRWIIDPLDGTTNYAHGYPFYSVSIALQHESHVLLGVVYDPVRDELFAAERGQGATLNERAIRVSTVERLDQALLCTGFPYNVRTSPKINLDHFSRFLDAAQAVRRDGSAALDLCYVAAGRFDGFWELNLAPWDMAAGGLIVTEAGGTVTRFDHGTFDWYVPEVLASNGLIHQEMSAVLVQKGT